MDVRAEKRADKVMGKSIKRDDRMTGWTVTSEKDDRMEG
jgi:hypothetical protein